MGTAAAAKFQITATCIRTAFLLLLLAISTSIGVGAAVLVNDSFDSDAPGTTPPTGWSLAGNISGTSAVVVAGSPAGNNQVDLHDDNGSSTSNNTLFRGFNVVTSGVVTAQFDICFLQDSAGFGTRLTNGGVPTSGGSWATGIVFQGNVAYEGGPSPPNGKICYQTQFNPYLYPGTGSSYQAGVWYTVRVIADVTARKYWVEFGPRGQTLSEITPAGGVSFVKNAATGVSPDRIGGITFFTSNRNGDAPGDLLVDNVRVEAEAIPVIHLATVAEAKVAPNGSFVRLSEKVVTAGTDQLTGGFFYIQDDTGGIRIRASAAVHQADKVTVEGVLTRAIDSGAASGPNGEKELYATVVTVTPGPFPLPPPVGIMAKRIGGSPFGPIESDGNPSQPGVYGGNGPNNVGRYVRVWGKVVYWNDADNILYIDDGSGVIDGSSFPSAESPIVGVRVLARKEVSLASLRDRYIILTGIAGCTSAGELGATVGVSNNVRLIRLIEEIYTDMDSSGRWDPGEPYVDSNRNGCFDGLTVAAWLSEKADKRFDVVTFCCPCTLTDHLCKGQFDALNWISPNGHYLAMGSDAHRAEVEGNGNVLAAYYNTLNDGYPTITGAEKADQIEARFASYFPSGIPRWVILNEISPGIWPDDAAYRRWVHDVVHRLTRTYGHSVIVYSPFPTPAYNAADWRAVAEDAYIAIECYLSGEEIKNQGFSVSWCKSTYAYSRGRYISLGVPQDRLFLGENFQQTFAGTGWGRAGVSYSEWDAAMNARHTAAHNVGFAGFLSYAWGKNDMGVSDEELIHFEETYRSKPLP